MGDQGEGGASAARQGDGQARVVARPPAKFSLLRVGAPSESDLVAALWWTRIASRSERVRECANVDADEWPPIPPVHSWRCRSNAQEVEDAIVALIGNHSLVEER